MVGDRQNSQRPALVAGGEDIELGRLHLDAEDAVALHLGGEVGAFVIEDIRGIDAAHMGAHAKILGGGGGGGEKAVIGAGRKAQLAEDAARGGRDGARGHGEDHIAHRHVILHPAARSDADQRLGAVIANELVGIDRQRRHPHARALNGHLAAIPCAGKTQHTAHLIDADRIFEKGLGGPFGAIGIAGHENGFRNVAGFGTNMNCHLCFP